MKITILVFGMAKELVDGEKITLSVSKNSTIGQIKCQILNQYPNFKEADNFMLAINGEYSYDKQKIVAEADEIALIPPTSGG